MNISRESLMRVSRFIAAPAALIIAMQALPVARADGLAVPWQMGFQTAATPVMEDITAFHNMMLWIIALIMLFVTCLLAYVLIRFRESANPTPTTTTHNTLVEVLWTALPILILVVIAIPSFKLLYYGDRAADAELTIKATGHQWYWSYEYPDHGGFSFDATMLEDDELKAGQPRLLTTDESVVLPVDTSVRLLVTAEAVIHSWAMPSFGVKLDGVPGRTNETWFKATRTGTYYGQCSELCGVRHGFMPITVKIVSKAEFAKWVKKAYKEYARGDGGNVSFADAAKAGPTK
jgi:cytochrome c oxidase subunit 2